MSASAAQVSVRVAAGLEAAFDAFTGKLGAWWRPHPLFATTPPAPGAVALLDPGPDGRLVETLADGRTFEFGRVIAWERPVRVSFSWRPASLGPEDATEVEVSFTAVGELTRVTVTHRGWERVPSSHVARHGAPPADLMRRLGEWWTAQLARYKAEVTAASAES